MNKTFVSLGPFCLSAAILEAAHLRNGSYPLDWAQSGYSTIRELVTLSIEAFYYRNIYTPSIHYYQSDSCNSSPTDMFPLESSIKSNLFGYPYFYNPHRKLGLESKDYFFRTLRRWKAATSSPSEVTFLLADYSNNPGSIFFHHPYSPLNSLSELLSSLVCNHKIVLLRLNIFETNHFIKLDNVLCLSEKISIISINYPRMFVGCQELHDLSMPILARIFLSFLDNDFGPKIRTY